MPRLRTLMLHATMVSLVTTLALGSPSSFAARIKCWTNDEGVKECGNKVPPKYAQKGHSEVSKSGLTVRKQKAAISAEEKAKREAERQAEIDAQKEKERLAKIERKRQRRQAAQDRVLLDTFVTEEDLKLAHERKVQSIESRIGHRHNRIKKLEVSLGKLQKVAANQERQGKKVGDKTLSAIDEVQRQIDTSERSIKDAEAEIEKLNAEYEADLSRYRFLKNGGRVGAPLQQS